MKIDVKVKKHEKIYTGKFINFYADDIIINNKVNTRREYIYYPLAVGIIPVTEDNRIIMVEQYRYTNDYYSLEIPAGKIDEGEALETAAHRELQEETGYDFGRLEKVYEYYPAISYSKERLIIYAAYDLIKKELPPDEDEFIEVKFFTLDEILELIKENKIMDGKTVLSILAYVTFIQKKGL